MYKDSRQSLVKSEYIVVIAFIVQPFAFALCSRCGHHGSLIDYRRRNRNRIKHQHVDLLCIVGRFPAFREIIGAHHHVFWNFLNDYAVKLADVSVNVADSGICFHKAGDSSCFFQKLIGVRGHFGADAVARYTLIYHVCQISVPLCQDIISSQSRGIYAAKSCGGGCQCRSRISVHFRHLLELIKGFCNICDIDDGVFLNVHWVG